MSTFLDRALPFIQLGIPVIPLVPRDKMPPSSMTGWQKGKFTTDLRTVEAWCAENPDYNVGLVAQAVDGGFCFLEFDGHPRMKGLAEVYEQPVPPTRVHISDRGGVHYIFKHTERSMALGNRSAGDAEKGEWFSFRSHNEFLVGAGSIHPNGCTYAVHTDVAPVPIPDWVCDFVETNTEKQREPSGEMPWVEEDFDFDDWCEWYSDIFTIPNAHCQGWMTTDVCPWSGTRHEQSTHTGFYYDGSHLGFHCFAQGCEGHGKGIGETIKMLNAKVGKPYPHRIWPERDLDFGSNVQDVTEPGPESEDAVMAALFSDGPPVQPPRPFAVEAPKPQASPHDLAMPESAMYGQLGAMAREMKMPIGLAYPALLACYSALPIHDEMNGTRLNMFVALLACVGGGKDTAYKRGTAILAMRAGVDYEIALPASDRGIGTLLGDQPKKKGEPRQPGPRRMLLVTEEIEELLKKGGIEKSSLFQTLCTLFDGNRKTFADKHGKQTVDCRLSWLGGIPTSEKNPEKFSEVFGETSTHGLLSRMLLGYSGTRWNYRAWEVPDARKRPEHATDLGEESIEEWKPKTLVRGLNPEAQAMYDRWEPEDGAVRDKYYLMKIALLTASANEEDLVTVPCMAAAIVFMEWQARLRQVFSPGVAENILEAKATERILKTLRRKALESDDEYIPWRRVSHDSKWTQAFGASVVVRVINGLIECGELQPRVETVTDENGREKTKTDKNYVKVTGIKASRGESPYTKNGDKAA